MEVILVVVTALISGLFATIITLFWQNKMEAKRRKFNVFETLMSYRYMISSEQSVKALNSIDVIFYKDAAVRNAYKEFLAETEKPQSQNPNINDKQLLLLEEISKALNLKNINWDTIKHMYYPTGLADKINEENQLRKIQIQKNTLELLSAQDRNKKGSTIDSQIPPEVLIELVKNPESLKRIIEFSSKIPNKMS